MVIKKLIVTVEPFVDLNDTLSIRVIVETDQTEQVRLEQVVPDNDFVSLWDHLWFNMGKKIKSVIEDVELIK